MVVVERERNDGANAVAWVVALILIVLLVLGAIWLWRSGAIFGDGETTNIEIEQEGGGGTGGSGGGGGEGGSVPGTTSP